MREARAGFSLSRTPARPSRAPVPLSQRARVCCSHEAGPETLTGNGLEETRLLASSKELFQLLRCAEAASDHITHQPLRTALMQCVFSARDLILDPARTVHEDPHGYVDAIAHIAKETTVPMAYVPPSAPTRPRSPIAPSPNARGGH